MLIKTKSLGITKAKMLFKAILNISRIKTYFTIESATTESTVTVSALSTTVVSESF